MSQYIRKNGAYTKSELETKNEPIAKYGDDSRFDLNNLSQKERVILEAARGLNKRGEEISQEKLYDEVCDQISDYTEFTEATEELSYKGYLTALQ